MSDLKSSFPRIWTAVEDHQPGPASANKNRNPVEAIATSFEQLTGWTLSFRETHASHQNRKSKNLGTEDSSGELIVDDLSASVGPDRKALDRKTCQKLASGINELLATLTTTREHLRIAKTELATSVAGSIPSDEVARIETLLRQLLATAAGQFGFESASLWLVNDIALTMEQSAAVGKHFPLATPNRDLANARADVRAMTGNVIVVDDFEAAEQWQVPAKCRSAICVPVSTLSNIYGTMWIVRDDSQPVDDHTTCMLEVIAGRIACELERVALLRKISEQQADFPAGESDCAAEIPPLHSDAADNEGTIIQPPFDGWNLELPKSSGLQVAPTNHWTGWSVTSSETMMVLSAHVHREKAKSQIRRLRSAFESYCALQISPSKLLDGLIRMAHRVFENPSGLSLCCIEIDPLTGEYRWSSFGADWGQISATDPDLTDRLIASSGCAVLPRNSALTLSVPGTGGIWTPTLVIHRQRSPHPR